MPSYVEFSDGILVQVDALDAVEVLADDGLVDTGFGRRIRASVTTAGEELQGALERAVSAGGQAIIAAAQVIDPVPKTVELTFGVNATGEVGNLAVGKGSAQANFTVRLVWELVASQ